MVPILTACGRLIDRRRTLSWPRIDFIQTLNWPQYDKPPPVGTYVPKTPYFQIDPLSQARQMTDSPDLAELLPPLCPEIERSLETFGRGVAWQYHKRLLPQQHDRK